MFQGYGPQGIGNVKQTLSYSGNATYIDIHTSCTMQSAQSPTYKQIYIYIYIHHAQCNHTEWKVNQTLPTFHGYGPQGIGNVKQTLPYPGNVT